MASKTPSPRWTMWSSRGMVMSLGSVTIPPKTLEYMQKYLPERGSSWDSFPLNSFWALKRGR